MSNKKRFVSTGGVIGMQGTFNRNTLISQDVAEDHVLAPPPHEDNALSAAGRVELVVNQFC